MTQKRPKKAKKARRTRRTGNAPGFKQQSFNLDSVLAAIPEVEAEQIKQIAAKAAGKKAKDLSVEEAVGILGNGGNNPLADKLADAIMAQIPEETMAQLEEQLQAEYEAGNEDAVAAAMITKFPGLFAEAAKKLTSAPQTIKTFSDDTADPTGTTAEPLENAADKDAEIQRLMKLPLTEINDLPQEKKELVWGELSQQLAEITEPIAEETRTIAQALVDAIKPGTENSLAKIGEDFAISIQALLEELPKLAIISEDEIERYIQQSKKLKIFSPVKEVSIEEAARIYDDLTPYINTEYAEHPELYKGNDSLKFAELIAAAAQKARADGKDIPLLSAEQALINANSKEEERRKHIEDAHKRRELARQEGAFTAAETRLATIGEKELGFDYFTSAVLKLLPDGAEELVLDEQGRINLYNLTGEEKSIQEVLRNVDKYHTAFLMWLLGLAWDNSDIRETNSGNAIMPVYLPAVLEKMGIDPRPREWDKETQQIVKRNTSKTLAEMRFDRFMEFLRPLDKMAAWFGDELYPVARFAGYKASSETMSITAPYMFKLVEYAKLHATKHSAIRNIFHADIMTENQTAVEIANRIAMGLITRGVTKPDENTYRKEHPRKPIKTKTTRTAPDGTKTVKEMTFAPEPEPEPEPTIAKTYIDENGVTTTVTEVIRKKEKSFTFDIKFSSLIEDCPQLRQELDEIRNSNNKDKSQRINKKLQSTFTAAIRIIMKKSIIPNYYKNLTIKTGRFDVFKAPTNSTLSDRLVIRHYGKNPNYTE